MMNRMTYFLFLMEGRVGKSFDYNEETIMPTVLQALYYVMLGVVSGEIISCKKKLFRNHWVIKVRIPHYLGYEFFHLTAKKIWWEHGNSAGWNNG